MKVNYFKYAANKFENGIHKELGQDSFNFISLKGQGAFGKVYMVVFTRSPVKKQTMCMD